MNYFVDLVLFVLEHPIVSGLLLITILVLVARLTHKRGPSVQTGSVLWIYSRNIIISILLAGAIFAATSDPVLKMLCGHSCGIEGIWVLAFYAGFLLVFTFVLSILYSIYCVKRMNAR